jgi:hypothetical protein
MKKLVSFLSLAALWPSGTSSAQLAKHNEMGVTWGHIHVIVPEREKETRSWLTLGGQLGNNLTGDNVAVFFPGIVILLGNGKNVGGSEGSVVDHIAFRVPNVEASMAKWKAANWGLKEKSEPGAKPGQAFVLTSSQVKVEILEDKSLKVPIVFDHVHFYVQEPGLQAEEDYYTKAFDAKPVKGASDTFTLPGAKLLFSKSATPTVSPTGRSLDHIGFEIAGSHAGLEAFSKTVEAKGVKWVSTYRKSAMGNARPLDPAGVMTELTHGVGGYADYKQIEAEVFPCENRSAKCW